MEMPVNRCCPRWCSQDGAALAALGGVTGWASRGGGRDRAGVALVGQGSAEVARAVHSTRGGVAVNPRGFAVNPRGGGMRSTRGRGAVNPREWRSTRGSTEQGIDEECRCGKGGRGGTG